MIISGLVRHFHRGSIRLSSLFSPEPSRVVRLLPSKMNANYESITFDELIKKDPPSNKILVRIVPDAHPSEESVPLFRFMSKGELELAVKRARKEHHKSAEDAVHYITEKRGRLKEKIAHLSHSLSKQEMDSVLKKVRKWLKSGVYVTVHVSDAVIDRVDSSSEFVDEVKRRIKDIEEEENVPDLDSGSLKVIIDHQKSKK